MFIESRQKRGQECRKVTKSMNGTLLGPRGTRNVEGHGHQGTGWHTVGALPLLSPLNLGKKISKGLFFSYYHVDKP